MFRPQLAPRSISLARKSSSLKEAFARAVPRKKELLKQLKTEYGSASLGEIKVENTLGGMRGLKCMLWEGSQLDPQEGIRFHGYSIPECQKMLPKGKTGSEMLPEGMFWLLLTGEVPTEAHVREFSKELAGKAQLPESTIRVMDSLSPEMHPMTQMSIAISSLNIQSKFARAYEQGLNKAEYWEPTFDDTIELLAKLPMISARIYSRSYRKNAALGDIDHDMDWCHNLAAMMGRADNTGFVDCLRLYIALHGDHEGGNVSAHTTHLVASALSDVFLSYSAGIQGLAGPLHGLAAQEVLRWILQMQSAIGDKPSDKAIEDYLWSTLNSGQVVPGYGHAVLRKPDPRFDALMGFARSRPEIASNPVWQLVDRNSRIAPEVLKKHGKTKNPFPNVDSSSGVLFHHYGVREWNFYTVIFGVSRALCLSQVIWDRALGLPIERPKSLTMASIKKLVEK